MRSKPKTIAIKGKAVSVKKSKDKLEKKVAKIQNKMKRNAIRYGKSTVSFDINELIAANQYGLVNAILEHDMSQSIDSLTENTNELNPYVIDYFLRHSASPNKLDPKYHKYIRTGVKPVDDFIELYFNKVTSGKFNSESIEYLTSVLKRTLNNVFVDKVTNKFRLSVSINNNETLFELSGLIYCADYVKEGIELDEETIDLLVANCTVTNMSFDYSELSEGNKLYLYTNIVRKVIIETQRSELVNNIDKFTASRIIGSNDVKKIDLNEDLIETIKSNLTEKELMTIKLKSR